MQSVIRELAAEVEQTGFNHYLLKRGYHVHSKSDKRCPAWSCLLRGALGGPVGLVSAPAARTTSLQDRRHLPVFVE